MPQRYHLKTYDHSYLEYPQIWNCKSCFSRAKNLNVPEEMRRDAVIFVCLRHRDIKTEQPGVWSMNIPDVPVSPPEENDPKFITREQHFAKRYIQSGTYNSCSHCDDVYSLLVKGPKVNFPL